MNNFNSNIDTEYGSFENFFDIYLYMMGAGLKEIKGEVNNWGKSTKFSYSLEEIKGII